MFNDVFSKEFFYKPWPSELVTAIAYHEVGHMVIAAHNGMVVKNVWVGDGRPKDDTSDDTVQGQCATQMWVGPYLFTPLLKEIYQNVGPEGAEILSPNFRAHKDLETKYPDYFPRNAPDETSLLYKQFRKEMDIQELDLLSGTVIDLMRAFGRSLPFFEVYGIDPITAANGFTAEFRIPNINLMKLYEDLIHDLAQVLVKKRYMTGDEVYVVMARHGVYMNKEIHTKPKDFELRTAGMLAMLATALPPELRNTLPRAILDQIALKKPGRR